MKFNFQFVIIAIFLLAAIFGVLVFSGAIPIGGGNGLGNGETITLWGTVPAALIGKPLENFNNTNEGFTIAYVEKSAATFDHDLLEALASGQGPDLFFLPDNLAYHYANKIFTIPYGSYPLSTFKSVFAGAGEVFLTNEGILAFPISIDPLMLYYNRNILDSENIVSPPTDWEVFTSDIVKLTRKNDAGTIERSGAALGQYANVAHAKEILTALFLQAGNPILKKENGRFASALDTALGSYNLPSVLGFYTSFANPGTAVYSWNRSFPDSRDTFSNEDLAFYFGFASELAPLVAMNPNQDFFVAPLPQIKGSKSKLTYGRSQGIAVSAFSRNLNTALAAASFLSSSDFAAKYAIALGVAPARRDLLAQAPSDAFSPIFYSSALFARSWLDPSPEDTGRIWSEMVNSVLSNNLTPNDALKAASSKLDLLLLQ